MMQQLLRDLEVAWRGDADLLASLYHPECSFEDKALALVHYGRDGVREAFRTAFAMMPDFAVRYGAFVGNNEQVAARWTFTGTFSDPARGGGSARPVAVEGISFMTLSESLILRNVDFWNPQDLTARPSDNHA